jgi:hypothetical protein
VGPPVQQSSAPDDAPHVSLKTVPEEYDWPACAMPEKIKKTRHAEHVRHRVRRINLVNDMRNKNIIGED